MSVKAILRSNVAKIGVLSLSILLTGCGTSGGGSGDGESGSTALTTATEPSDVPLELITMEDPSAVVDAFNRGIDPEFQLLRTPFHCYYNLDVSGTPITDFSAPHVSVDFVGDSFRGTGILGDFTGSIDDVENSDQIIFTFDGLDTEVSSRINFDIFGQWYQTDDSICFQSGASHERALHQFLLNTPEEGDFSCLASVNGSVPSNAGPLLLLSGNRYSYNQSEGTYQFAEFFDSNVTAFQFDTGLFAGVQGEYTENPDTGTQQLNFAEETSQSTLNCSRQRQPRPFKRFGADLVPRPPASSEPILGDFYSDNGNERSVGWVQFSSDGFLNADYASPGSSILCQRTLPNGLEPCARYTYNGGSTITLFRQGRQEVTIPVNFNSEGTITLQAIGSRFVPINTPTASELIGQWRLIPSEDLDVNNASLCLFAVCESQSVSTHTYEFLPNGRFNFSSTSPSESPSTGVYLIDGTGIELRHDSGKIEPPDFLHLLDANKLVFGRSIYQR